jgi:hypothetical protein
MTRNTTDFFAGRNHEPTGDSTIYLHGTNQRLNVGDLIKPNGDSLVQSGNHGGVYGLGDAKDDPRAHQPRAWVVPVTGYVSSENARHAMSYAVRAEQTRPTKEKRAYVYQVEPISKAEKFPSPENEVSSADGFRITKIVADAPQSHYRDGHWMDRHGIYLTEHQKGYNGKCDECAAGAIGLQLDKRF